MEDQKKERIKDPGEPFYPLHNYEAWLIKKWRTKYRFSEITISVQNGVPQRIKNIIVSDDPRDDGVTEGPQSKT